MVACSSVREAMIDFTTLLIKREVLLKSAALHMAGPEGGAAVASARMTLNCCDWQCQYSQWKGQFKVH